MSEFKQRLLKRCKRGIFSGNEIGYLDRLPTRIASLDYILGGGLPVGRVMQVWGPESAGKSALCLSMIKARQDINPEALFFYVDAEATVTQEDLDVHQIDKEQLIFYRPLGGEDAIDAALAALTEGAEIAVIDSVPYLRPKKVLDEIQKDASYRDVSSIASLLERVQSKIVLTLEQSEGCLIFINQQRESRDSYYSTAVHPGGAALKYMLSISLYVSGKKDKDNPQIVTQSLLTKKNKTFTPLKRTTLTLDNRRVRRGESLLSCCVDFGLIKEKGGGYIAFEQSIADKLGHAVNLPRTSVKCGQYFDENPELFLQLWELLTEKIKTEEQPKDKPEEQPEETANIYND